MTGIITSCKPDGSPCLRNICTSYMHNKSMFYMQNITYFEKKCKEDTLSTCYLNNIDLRHIQTTVKLFLHVPVMRRHLKNNKTNNNTLKC